MWGLGDLRDRLVEWCGCGAWSASWYADQGAGTGDSPLHADNGLHKGLLDDPTHQVFDVEPQMGLDKELSWALGQGAPSSQSPHAGADEEQAS